MAMDQKTMKLDAFAKYRIVNPLKFYQSVQNDQKLKMRIGSVIESSVREVVGTFPFIDVLGNKRTTIIDKITNLVKKQAENFGIDIIDVRIIRIGLPDKAREAVYNRMRTDRMKEAKEIRAQGAEEALAIKANADKEKVIIIAEAKKQSEILKGDGDAAAIKIFSGAVSNDPEFFNFYRSLEAYKNSLKGNNSTVVISSDSPFMKYFGN
jgi:membrane protease subunit HflC